ncbi:MAG: ERCC4 domain-containing protein [Syntrophobacteraceae bacterium]
MQEHKITIIQDSREQRGYDFAKYPDVVCEAGALETGDYSLPGFTDRIGIERKAINDMIGCLSQDRARFERELQRARSFELFAVIIEDSLPNVMAGRYRSQMKSQAVIQSIAAFSIRYRIPFLFCGDRAGGELMTYSLLSKYAYEVRKRFEQLHQAKENHV